jgi:hypothetical protein
VRYETGSGRHPEGLTTQQEGKALGKITVGQQNSEAIEIYYEDHGTVSADTRAPQGLELRHLRYFAAVAEAGTFTRAAGSSAWTRWPAWTSSTGRAPPAPRPTTGG